MSDYGSREEHFCTPAGRPSLGRLHLDLPTALPGAALAAGLAPVGPRWHLTPSWPLRPTQSPMNFFFKRHIMSCTGALEDACAPVFTWLPEGMR